MWCVSSTRYTNANNDRVCMSAFVSMRGTYRVGPTRQMNTEGETYDMGTGFVRNRGDFHARPSVARNAAHRHSPAILGAVTRIVGDARYRLQRRCHRRLQPGTTSIRVGRTFHCASRCRLGLLSTKCVCAYCVTLLPTANTVVNPPRSTSTRSLPASASQSRPVGTPNS